MTENITNLIDLFEDGRKNIGRIDYENPTHLEFITKLLGAFKNAVPEIRVLCNVSKDISEIKRAVCGEVTIQAQQMEPSHSPSIEILREPQTERSTHTQEESRNTGGTAEAPDHKSDTSDTPAPAAATPLDAARKAAAASKTQPGRAPRQNAKPKANGAPQQ